MDGSSADYGIFDLAKDLLPESLCLCRYQMSETFRECSLQALKRVRVHGAKPHRLQSNLCSQASEILMVHT